MLERASGQFTIEGQVEDIFGGISGATRIARISQTCLFTGTLEGESIAEYTAVLPRETDGSFQGFQRISGALGEREGSFVVQVTGDYAKGQPRGSWTIVPKSGSGDFVHIRGGGSFSQSAGKPGSYKFEFDLRKPRKARDTSASVDADADALIPGIDIVAEEETTPAIELPADTPVVAKPARRSRKKVEPTVTEPVTAATEPVTPRKRSPKKAESIDLTATEAATPPKRSRTKTTQAPAPVEATPAPARKRSRKTATPVVPVETPAVVEPKPVRRKKTSPPEPVPLSIAQNKPARSRKAKAA